MLLQVKKKNCEIKFNQLFCNIYIYILAVENGHILAATVLLDNRANIDAKTNDGRTPLLLAKAKKHEHMVALLKAK